MAKYSTTLLMIYKQVNKENIVGNMIAKTTIDRDEFDTQMQNSQGGHWKQHNILVL